MNFWYSKTFFAKLYVGLLSPLALLFWLISSLRRILYQRGILPSYLAPVPVIVVGNLSVGGNGKTPVVIWLIQQLQQRGLKIGVISRGYGGKSSSSPKLVTAQSQADQVGDEPLLIAKRTQTLVCVSPNRQQAIELLLKNQSCDLIISDDGLQHYALQRDVEIVVIETQRGFGNGFLLPAGPLRELPSRLQDVDFIIANGEKHPQSHAVMQLKPSVAVNLLTNEQRPLSDFRGKSITAIAAIGNPSRFFTMLKNMEILVGNATEFPDHHQFSPKDFQSFSSEQPLFMTEKDAVKCLNFAQKNWWYVPVETQISGEEAEAFLNKLLHLCLKNIDSKNTDSNAI